jgi:hypothetical protein
MTAKRRPVGRCGAVESGNVEKRFKTGDDDDDDDQMTQQSPVEKGIYTVFDRLPLPFNIRKAPITQTQILGLHVCYISCHKRIVQ